MYSAISAIISVAFPLSAANNTFAMLSAVIASSLTSLAYTRIKVA